MPAPARPPDETPRKVSLHPVALTHPPGVARGSRCSHSVLVRYTLASASPQILEPRA